MCSDSVLTDKKKVIAMKSALDNLAPTKKDRIGSVDDLDLPGWFTKIENSINDRKDGYEEQLKAEMEEILDSPASEIPQANTSIQKRITELIKEIWAQVVTTTCPICKHKSPAVKRDGFTKLFVKPLAARSAMAARQSKALQGKKDRSRSRDSTRSQQVGGAANEDRMETQTNASTAKNQSQRKTSAATE